MLPWLFLNMYICVISIVSYTAIRQNSNLGFYICCRFIPFSGGPRKCVGDQFALLEAIVSLAIVLQHMNFELVPNQNISMSTGATIHTTNVNLHHLCLLTYESFSFCALTQTEDSLLCWCTVLHIPHINYREIFSGKSCPTALHEDIYHGHWVPSLYIEWTVEEEPKFDS